MFCFIRTNNELISSSHLISHLEMMIPPVPFCQITLKALKPPDLRYPKELKTIGDHVRKKRLDLKLTAKELAKHLGIHQDTVYGWEYNSFSRTIPKLPRIWLFTSHGEGSVLLDTRRIRLATSMSACASSRIEE